jgi:diadenosine tetraphosphate (Ap4A) HIT family hydrolase
MIAMKDSDIFCKIVKGEAPAFKIYEDRNFIAILDAYPNIKGQTLIISKKHRSGYAFDLDEDELKELVAATKKVARLLERKLRVKRVHVVIEGMGIDHLHVKLYPAVGLKDKYGAVWAKEKRHFSRYPGYVTTLMGPKASEKELKKLMEKITG